MNFKSFQVSTTNIFPCSNDTKGGQLLTEYNLKSRDCIDTDENISYMTGRSAVHSESDFKVSGDNGILTISEGKGVINGHFIESLSPIVIDLLDANQSAIESGKSRLTGVLCVGLRVYYSTKNTMAGAMKTIDETGEYYEGIQVVILPQAKFKTPEDAPNDETKVTAHLRLATFNFTNGVISNVQNNIEKCQSIPASRIKNLSDVITGDFASTTGLKSNRYYTIRGKNEKDKNSNTWCDSTDSLMVWDEDIKECESSEEYNAYTSPGHSAKFIVEGNKVRLYVPHKQIAGKDNQDTSKYRPVRLDIPVADYHHSTPGIVDSNYTDMIKSVLKTATQYYTLPNGNLVMYIDRLTDRSQLPETLLKNATSGCYVLVNKDETVSINSMNDTYPSTMYAIIRNYKVSRGILCSDLNDIRIDYSSDLKPVMFKKYADIEFTVSDCTSLTPEETSGLSDVCDSVFEDISNIWDLYDTSKVAIYAEVTLKDSSSKIVTKYYHVVSVKNGSTSFCDPITLSGITQFASTDLIGGFKDVSEDAIDQGYVKLDENGNLRLVDYGLLRTGVLAYQLGEDVNIDSKYSNAELQNELDEKVNERVAFPNYSKRMEAIKFNTDQNIIDINIYLHQESNTDNENALSQITIFDIDSRFNCAVRIHIDGDNIDSSVSDNDKVTLNIINCEKIILDIKDNCNAKINLIDSCLYYDANVLDRLDNIKGLKLWYERFSEEDPYLVVNDMTVSAPNNTKVIESSEFWSESSPSDVHFKYALAGLTFSDTGEIVNFDAYVKADITNSISTGISIYTFELSLPQSEEFAYPAKRLHAMKLNGSFITAYIANDNGDSRTYISNVSFGAITTEGSLSGNISFYLDTKSLPSTSILGNFNGELPAWEDSKWNVFHGSVYGGLYTT